MTDSSHGVADVASGRREIGRIRGAAHGPTVIVVGGIHGNEPAGIHAARRILARFESGSAAVRGEIIFLAGNLTALGKRRRFIHLDLNRQWTPDKTARIAEDPEFGRAAEYAEQQELYGALSNITAEASAPMYFLDLHTSSADGPPFVTVGDTLRNRRFASHLPLPLILGLEEQVDGALLEYLNNFGLITLGVEGGRHDADSSVDNLEAVLWLALVAAGAIEAGALADLDLHRERLAHAGRGFPRVIEVRRRQAVSAGDDFRMEPGFTNFAPVRRGQVLAHDGRGPIRAPESGLLLLPLYQGLGDDGFFISRKVRPIWLRVSAFLRQLRLAWLLPLLPGVRRHADDPETLVVNTRVARWYPLEVFHLFGFRKRRSRGAELVVSRRRHDLEPPPVIALP